MATSDPWRCMYCKKISKATANGCSQCLTAWQDCQDTTYVPPSKQQKYSSQQHQSNWDWDYSQDGSHTPRTPKGRKIEWQQPKSPRQGRGKGRGKGKKKDPWQDQSHHVQKGKTKEAGQDKGKGAMSSSQGTTMIPPEPPWTVSSTGLAPLPPPTEPPPKTAEGAILKELLTALKKSPTEQDPEVKAIVQRTSLARRPGCSTDIVLSSGRSHNCPRSIGLCTTGTSQPAHSLEEFLSRCSGQVAKTHDRFPEGGKGTYKSDRGCSTGTTQCRHQVRRVQTRAWRPSCRCRCRSYNCRRIRRCRKGHDRCCSSGEPIHNVSTTDLITSISRGHGDRRSELQQEAKNRWRPRWAILLCRSWVASWIAVAQCPIDATISTREAAFCSARQVVTEKYACLGQNKHPLLLKWGHSACQESWFVPEWEAHEAAFELSWKLGSSRSSCPTDVKLLKPTCGRDRHVQFSNDVDLCICSSTAPMRISFKTTDAFIKQWPEKPWSLKSQCRKSSGTSLEPQSNRAVLIRKNHQELPFTQIRTTDEFHNVPSSWFPAATDPEMQEAEEEDETQFFLHEEPESVQILFDALLREGLIIGPRLTESVFFRTWHIHHIREHRCWHPRIIKLNGHWRTWFADIVSGWRDKNEPTEETIFSIVHPDPPRSNLRHEIMFDLIIAQGLEAPRKAGLITVLQKDEATAQRTVCRCCISA